FVTPPEDRRQLEAVALPLGKRAKLLACQFNQTRHFPIGSELFVAGQRRVLVLIAGDLLARTFFGADSPVAPVASSNDDVAKRIRGHDLGWVETDPSPGLLNRLQHGTRLQPAELESRL